jgi:hypothetical protein
MTMATVPITDSNVTPMMPDALRPRPVDFLMAAAMLHSQGQLKGQQLAANFAQRFSGEQDRMPVPRGTYPLTVGKANDLVYRTQDVKRKGDVTIREDQLISK